jgi:homoserine kinase type II
VHADFFPDNVFFEGENVSGVIDFYFACTESFAYDLMLAVNAWCGADEKKIKAFMSGYASARALSRAEKAALPLMGRAAALRIASTRLYDLLHPKPGAVVTPKDPLEHVRLLRRHKEKS